MNIVKLPSDIVYEISKYISLKDISHLKMSSKLLNEKINDIQNSIIIRNMKIFDAKKSINLNQTKNDYLNSLNDMFYGLINYYLSIYLNKYKKMFCKDFYWKKNIYNKSFLKHYILNFDQYHMYPRNYIFITENTMLNHLFNKIFKFYVIKDYIDIRYYPNRLELYILYNLIQIEIFQTMYNFDYTFEFLESINNYWYYNIKIKYYNYILNTFHTNNIDFTFVQMHKMSLTVTSIPIIKKIFGYKILDLSNTQLNLCCYDCNEINLYRICNMKRGFWNDHLISHNYMELKEFLQRENAYYHNILINQEIRIVNDMIYIKNPITNRRVRLNGQGFYNLMNYLEKNMRIDYIKLCMIIKKRQDNLIEKFFT